MQMNLAMKLSPAACFMRVLAVVVGLLLVASASYAEQRIKYGWVMARSMVLDENGQPIRVEYNELGNEVKELQLPASFAGSVDSVEGFSAADYLSQQQKIDPLQILGNALCALYLWLIDAKADYGGTPFWKDHVPFIVSPYWQTFS